MPTAPLIAGLPPNAVVPNPDPSIITSQAIDRSSSAVESKLTIRVDALEKALVIFRDDLTRVPTQLDRSITSVRELIETRLDGMDKDIVRMHTSIDTRANDIREQILHLRELMESRHEELSSVMNERFVGVASQFSERDTRTDQRAGDTKLAVDAAFAASNQATSKIEASFSKSIDSQQAILVTNTKATDDKIGDLKDRLTTIESRTLGISAQTATHRSDTNVNIAMVMMLMGALSLIASIIMFVLRH